MVLASAYLFPDMLSYIVDAPALWDDFSRNGLYATEIGDLEITLPSRNVSPLLAWHILKG